MEPMKIEGLKQSPAKPIERKFEKVKVEEVPVPPANVSVNLIDTLRLIARKKFENLAFYQLEISTGKKAAIAGGGGLGLGLFATINWALLLTGNPLEIIKLVLALIGFGLAFFWKK